MSIITMVTNTENMVINMENMVINTENMFTENWFMIITIITT